MTQQTYRSSATRNGWAYGMTLFAGVWLTAVGLFQALEGISAIAKDTIYAKTPDYVFQFDVTTWGWIHLTIGVIALVVGVCLLLGQSWALVVGIIMATISALANFMYLPWYPLWALVIVALDIAVIWALSTEYSARR
ncbi:MAG: hypothetical protein HOQ22_13640 [Nocardioidaceae bacterium]|nr:hypothetical protein [Nocardioidaceae bacterium]NUS52067.1 hypothetical protein [Nocardioidaceae bacterium]